MNLFHFRFFCLWVFDFKSEVYGFNGYEMLKSNGYNNKKRNELKIEVLINVPSEKWMFSFNYYGKMNPMFRWSACIIKHTLRQALMYWTAIVGIRREQSVKQKRKKKKSNAYIIRISLERKVKMLYFGGYIANANAG